MSWDPEAADRDGSVRRLGITGRIELHRMERKSRRQCSSGTLAFGEKFWWVRSWGRGGCSCDNDTDVDGGRLVRDVAPYIADGRHVEVKHLVSKG